MLTYFKSEGNNKFDYNLRLSAWGIWFSFRIYVEPYDNLRHNRVKVQDGLWVNICDKIINAEEKEFIIKGLKMVSHQIIEKSTYKNTLLIICDFDISNCDFQADALTDAVLKWAEITFGIKGPEVKIGFDKKKNKYIFNYQET